ncbi:MAG: Crp/Fnr family transcriptional regulator [Candidatus Omnitrophica bacterium]|nr:Crp/Fnr family transcriptional regulator [Candidatus Omnitrophota bacterium]
MSRRYGVELFLRQAEFFKNLSSKERQHVASQSLERTYAKGQTIFHEGHSSDSVWLVMEGRAHLLHYLSVGRVQTTCVMTPGEIFCCLPALDRGTYPATAVAATKAKILQIPSRIFHGLMQSSPAMLQQALCLFCSRLRQVEAKGCLAYDPVEQRIAQAILTLQKKFGDTIPLTRQEISELVGTTVETAIRTLSRFQKRGWLRLSRGSIQILQAGALSKLSSLTV